MIKWTLLQVIITINSGNNKLSCVVQKITIVLLAAIAIVTKDGNEGMNLTEAYKGSRKENQTKNTKGKNGEKINEMIGEMKKEKIGGTKDATIDVTNEQGEAGREKEKAAATEMEVIDTNPQNAVKNTSLDKRKARTASKTTIDNQRKYNSKKLELHWKDSHPTTGHKVARVTRSRFRR